MRGFWLAVTGFGEVAHQATENASRIKSHHSAILLFQIDGALNELSAGHSPAGNRNAAGRFSSRGRTSVPPPPFALPPDLVKPFHHRKSSG